MTPEPPKDDAKSKALVRAKANGFAQGKAVDPALRTTTQRYDEIMEPDLDMIFRKVKRVWIRGLDDDNIKVAMDAAHKITGHLYRPDTKVQVEHSGNAGGNTYNVVQVQSLSEADKARLARAQQFIPIETSEVIDVEVIEAEQQDI